MQILQTDLHTSPLTISWENLIKDQSIFSMVIILLILIALSLDSVWILLGETCCWSLLALKGLKQLRRGSSDGKSWDLPRGQTLADLVVLLFFFVSITSTASCIPQHVSPSWAAKHFKLCPGCCDCKSTETGKPDFILTAARVAQLGERRSAEREAIGSNPSRTNTQGL